MCLMQYYSKYHCGCPVLLGDQVTIRTCSMKIRERLAECTIHVIPPSDSSNHLPESVLLMAEALSFGGGGSDKIRAEAKEAAESGDTLKCRAVILKMTRGFTSADTSPTGRRVMAASEKMMNSGTLAAFGLHKHPVTGVVRVHPQELWNTDDNWQTVHAAPRKCPQHEHKFELLLASFWQSETVWIQPIFKRRGYEDVKDLQYAQRCADRLWQLYLVWKFQGGCRGRDSVRAGISKNILPLDSETFNLKYAESENPHFKATAELDNCSTMRAVANYGSVDYRMLCWAMERMAKKLCDRLHPRELLGLE